MSGYSYTTFLSTERDNIIYCSPAIVAINPLDFVAPGKG